MIRPEFGNEAWSTAPASQAPGLSYQAPCEFGAFFSGKIVIVVAPYLYTLKVLDTHLLARLINVVAHRERIENSAQGWAGVVQEASPKYAGAVVLAMVLLAIVSSWPAPGTAGGKPAGPAPPGGRKILHYVDPMNPAHTSPEPGLAPCGMKMEPVYADDDGKAPERRPPSRRGKDQLPKTAAHRGAGGPGGKGALYPCLTGPGQGGGG